MKDHLLSRESRLARHLLSSFWICVASASAMLWLNAGKLQQAVGLVHAGIGMLFGLLATAYTLVHFLRTLGIRRPLLLFTGVIAVLSLFTLVGSGAYLAVVGQQENKRWLVELHYGVGFGACALILLHIILHTLLFPKKRKAKQQQVFLTLDRLPLAVVNISIAVSISLVGLWILAEITAIAPKRTAAVADYRYDYGSHPFRPSQTETAHNGFVAEEDIANSAFCADCHRDIATQWFASAHRQAASDPAYITNINLLEKRRGISATRYCEGCHAPVALLTGQLSPGGKHGGIKGTAANREGISCTSCHRIDSVVHTKGVASYQFAPAKPYLFGRAEHPLLQQVNRFLIATLPQQHRRQMATSVLSDPKHCATCHAQFMDKDMNDWGWVKMQDEYSAWLESPYADQHERRFSHTALQRCQDCHMPLVRANDPSADSNGMVRDHRFLGANTMLPALNNDSQQLALTTDFLQRHKMRLSIEKPYREGATQTLQAIDEELRSTPVKPWYFYKGESVSINVIVSNIGVGHDFPGGTVDINQAWVYFRVTDAEGNVITESGHMDGDHQVDSKAYFYRSLPVDRQGKLVWKHDLFNKIGEVSRNTVQSGESDVVEYYFTVPTWAKGPLFISSSLMYRKLNLRYAKWALKEQYRPLPVTEMARAFLSVPIRDQLEAH